MTRIWHARWIACCAWPTAAWRRSRPMFRPLALFVGARYTRAKRRNHYISFISLTSMLGLTLGVLAMIVGLSVMSSFKKVVRGRMRGTIPHATRTAVTPMDDWQAVSERVLAHPEVTGAVPLAELEGMVFYRGAMLPVQVNGI